MTANGHTTPDDSHTTNEAQRPNEARGLNEPRRPTSNDTQTTTEGTERPYTTYHKTPRILKGPTGPCTDRHATRAPDAARPHQPHGKHYDPFLTRYPTNATQTRGLGRDAAWPMRAAPTAMSPSWTPYRYVPPVE